MKIKIIILIASFVAILGGCVQIKEDPPEIKKGMVKVTILYENSAGKTFDMDYYSNKHMPLVADLLGDSLKLLAIDKGLSGRTPDDEMPFLAIGYLYFDTLSAYQNSFGPNAEDIVGDIPNFTNIQPNIQISEVIE